MFRVLCLLVPALLWPAAGSAEPPKKKGKITIGKDTTYVTEPRDKDGYIDYGTALNERLRQGVTPDNNANVRLFDALGPHPEGATMPPEFFKWMGIKAPPEKGRYMIASGRYMQKHREVDPSREIADLLKDFDACGRPWKSKQFPLVAGWLTANEEPLRVVREAVKRSHYFSPLVAKKTDDGPAGIIAVLLPGVQKCRELAWMLQIRAMNHIGEGRYDEAWQDLLTCHRLARHVGRGGTLIDLLVGVAIDHIASHADLVFLDRAKLDAKQVKACLRVLQSLPPLSKAADKIDLAERFMLLETVMMLDRRGIKYLDPVFFGRKGNGPLPEALAQKLMDGIDWDPALRNANAWYDRLVATMRLADRATREKQLDKFEADLRQLKVRIDDAETIAKLLADNPTPAARGKIFGDMLVAELMPALRKVMHASERNAQIERNLHVAFALGAYQRDHGRYPAKLDALAPKYLAQVPGDLFSGKALIYRANEKSYLVYSVGPNGRDEDGRWYDDTPPGDDPNVRMPLPPPRE